MAQNRLLSVFLLVTAGLIQSCASAPDRFPGQVARNGVAILGVTTMPDVNSAMSAAGMNNTLHDIVSESDNFVSFESYKVRKVIGDDRHQTIMDIYGKTGAVRPEDIQLLMAARLPVSYALIGRIEENRESTRGPTFEKLRNNAGELLSDREKVVLSTVRHVTLSATMINLRTGAAFWTRTYRAEPASQIAYTHYQGSSFAGSLAATMANTVANGIRKPAPPPPPSLNLTVRSLMREVVRNMPRR